MVFLPASKPEGRGPTEERQVSKPLSKAEELGWVYDPEAQHYDINEFYTRSTDDKGHYKSVRVNLPGYLKAQLDQIIAKDEHCPWRSVPDIFRDAVHHRLQWYAENRDDLEIDNVLCLQRAQERLARRDEERKESAALVELVANQLIEAKHEDDPSAIVAILSLAEHATTKMSAYWQAKMEAVVRDYQSYGRLAGGE